MLDSLAALWYLIEVTIYFEGVVAENPATDQDLMFSFTRALYLIRHEVELRVESSLKKCVKCHAYKCHEMFLENPTYF